jgi:hypothetical protein
MITLAVGIRRAGGCVARSGGAQKGGTQPCSLGNYGDSLLNTITVTVYEMQIM